MFQVSAERTERVFTTFRRWHCMYNLKEAFVLVVLGLDYNHYQNWENNNSCMTTVAGRKNYGADQTDGKWPDQLLSHYSLRSAVKDSELRWNIEFIQPYPLFTHDTENWKGESTKVMGQMKIMSRTGILESCLPCHPFPPITLKFAFAAYSVYAPPFCHPPHLPWSHSRPAYSNNLFFRLLPLSQLVSM